MAYKNKENQKINSLKYYNKNKKKILFNNKKYWDNNKEELKKSHKEYYEDNKNKILEGNKKYHNENKEKIQKLHKEYYENNKDKLKAQTKKYKEENKEKYKEYDKLWKLKNKDKLKKKSKKYNQTWRDNNQDKIKEIRNKLRFQNDCIDCGKKIHETSFRCLNCAKMGKNNPAWIGGLSFNLYDNNFNKKFKNLIRNRDNQICMLCGIPKEKLKRNLSVHHINYDKLLTIKENCVSLCYECHNLTNQNRDSWIVFFQNLLSKIYGYKYEDKNILLDFQKEVYNYVNKK